MELAHTQDHILLHRWHQSRDAEAFRALVERHAGLVYAAAHRVLRDATDAEDVSQECFITLARSRSLPERHLGAWLYTVAVNRAKDHIRGAARRRKREALHGAAQPDAVETVWDETLAHVDEAIAALDDELRHVIIAHFLEAKSQGEIADTIGISRQTVNARVKRGIEAIREHLTRKGITATTASLTALLGSQMVEAAPATLVAALGKVALSGGVPLAVSGIGVAKLVGFASVLIVLASAFTLLGRWESKRSPLQMEKPDTVEVSTTSPHVRQTPNGEVTREPVYNEVDATEASDRRGSLSGTLKDRTGRPILGASLEIIGSNGGIYHVDVDERGQYSRDGIGAGKYTITARSSNQQMAENVIVEYVSATLETELAVGEERIGVDLSCDCEVTKVGGRVVDEMGSAIPNLQLRMMNVPGVTERAYVGTMSARTDANGSFHFDAYGPGEYWLVSDEDGAKFRLAEFPVVSRSGETDLELLATDQSGEMLHIQIVDGESGSPVEHFGYRTSEGGGPPPSEREFPDGRGSIHLPSANHVYFYCSDAGSADYYVRPGDLGGGSVRIVLVPQSAKPQGSLTGRVVDAVGNPVQDAAVFPKNISLVDRRLSLARTDGSGDFVLPVGESAANGFYVTRGVDPPVEPRVEENDKLLLVLPEIGSVRGRLRAKAEEISNVQVQLTRVPSAGDSLSFIRTASSDMAGEFEFSGLALGEYMLTVEMPLVQGVPCVGELQQRVTLGPSAESVVDFDFEVAKTVCEVTGTVSEGGVGLVGSIELQYDIQREYREYFTQGLRTMFRGNSDTRGEFTIESVLPGPVEIVVTRGGATQRAKRIPLDLRPGKNHVDIEFAPPSASVDCWVALVKKALFATYTLSIETLSGIEQVQRTHATVAETGLSILDVPAGKGSLEIEFYFDSGSQGYIKDLDLNAGEVTMLEFME